MEGAQGFAEDFVLEKYARAIVVKAHAPANGGGQVALHVNDIVCVMEKDPTGWWGGHQEGDEENSGWFPGSCVRILKDEALQMDPAESALHTQHRSPHRRNSQVASPQRYPQFTPEPASEAAQQPTAPASAAAVCEELARLRMENADLHKELRQWKRQSDLDNERLERELLRERKMRQQLEESLASHREPAALLPQTTAPVEAPQLPLQHPSASMQHVVSGAASAPRQLFQESLASHRELAALLRQTTAPADAPQLPLQRPSASRQHVVSGAASASRKLFQDVRRDALPSQRPVALIPALQAPLPPAAVAVSAALAACSVAVASVTTDRPAYEEPIPGIVAQKKALFNTLRSESSQKQHRSASCCGPRGYPSARLLGGGEAREAVAPLLASPFLTCPMGAAAAEAPEACITSFGMSPMARCRPPNFGFKK
eukprot:CAMPEP_0203843696 /NCGR_PEP_ID=MMETSP0359-20131031/2736_1 /ASSEMBLY_ACC=CAM_ASM_000338 /TAXON_ID=268821 /ORGANISM="Scrippsiella Hangoei, Strain SHTV-5" /LENGTH=429 /DNA_ID=CAMNT_0050758493 /DNA_START=94 /DNA_END=1383 /DNA_ORIENTATION=+